MGTDKLSRVEDLVQIRNVIVSVADKEHLDTFAPRLAAACPGMRFYATGGTTQYLRNVLGEKAPQQVVEITRYSTRPATHSGLARTTDFKLYLGLLADPWNDVHVNDISASGAVFFDMVISNMHSFPEANGAAELHPEEVRCRIDIGGPGMVRAGVRNFVRVAVIADTEDYDWTLDRIVELKGHTDLEMRLKLARRAFAITAENDQKILSYIERLKADQVREAYKSE